MGIVFGAENSRSDSSSLKCQLFANESNSCGLLSLTLLERLHWFYFLEIGGCTIARHKNVNNNSSVTVNVCLSTSEFPKVKELHCRWWRHIIMLHCMWWRHIIQLHCWRWHHVLPVESIRGRTLLVWLSLLALWRNLVGLQLQNKTHSICRV